MMNETIETDAFRAMAETYIAMLWRGYLSRPVQEQPLILRDISENIFGVEYRGPADELPEEIRRSLRACLFGTMIADLHGLTGLPANPPVNRNVKIFNTEYTFLHVLAGCGLREEAASMLAHGADPRILANGKTPANLAEDSGHRLLAQHLRANAERRDAADERHRETAAYYERVAALPGPIRKLVGGFVSSMDVVGDTVERLIGAAGPRPRHVQVCIISKP